MMLAEQRDIVVIGTGVAGLMRAGSWVVPP